MEEGSALNHKLRALREQKIWTIPEAAEAVGVDAQTFWRWENYVQWPRAYALRKLCTVFERSAEELGFRRSSDTLDHARLTRVEEPEETGSLLSRGVNEQGEAIIRLAPEQAEALLALLRNETTMNHFDPAKRATLRTLGELLKDAVVVAGSSAVIGEWMGQEMRTDPDPWERLARAHLTPSAMNTATLDHFERLLGECWKLTDLNELAAAEGILSRFLPTLIAIPSREVNAPIAYLSSQGLRLQSVLVHHRLDTSNKVLICQQAVEYARCAGDTNTLVTALIELAAAYKFERQLEKRLHTLQEALGTSVHATPLVQSRAYSNSASALAESGRIAEAQLYISLARDVFPDDPTADPGYVIADSSIFTLSYHAGKVYTYAGNVPEAFAACELYQQYSSGSTIPERIRLEIVNAQSRAAIRANDLERYASFLENALIGALALGSKKRFNETYRIFQEEMPLDWLASKQMKRLVEQYHLVRNR
jgi:transcriptional regulator with XRE-family HTH domain